MEEPLVSDDSTVEVEVAAELQDVSRPRPWRQRYDGPEGQYVYRTAMVIKGPGGTSRRVERGEPVDTTDIAPRRLKALWYSNNIELADPSAPRAGGRKLKKTLVDNVELQRQEEERVAAALNAAREENELRKRARAQAREEQRQRELAEEAVKAAEAREAQEMRELGLAEDRAAFEALVKQRAEEAAAKAEEDAQLEKELAAERAELEKIRAEAKAEEDAKAAALKAEQDAERRAKKEERAQARLAIRNGTRRFNEPKEDDGVPRNEDTRVLSGPEAKAEAANATGRPEPAPE